MALALLLASFIAAVCGLWWTVRRWGYAALCFAAMIENLVGASGVVSEHVWGPRWSWNFAHHGPGYAAAALLEAAFWLLFGLRLKRTEPSGSSNDPSKEDAESAVEGWQ